MTGVSLSIRGMVPAGASEPARAEEKPLPLRRRSGTEILDDGVELLVQRFASLLGVTALAWLPFQMAQEGLFGSSDLLTVSALGGGQVLGSGFALTAAVVVLARAVRPEVASGPSLLLRGAPAVLFLLVPAMAAAALSVCACILPAFVLMSWVVLIPPVLVLEGLPDRQGPFAIVYTARRSLALAFERSAFLRFLVWFFVARIVFGGFLGLVEAGWQSPAGRAHVADFTGLRGTALSAVVVSVNTVLNGLATALLACAAIVHYVELRVRREGWDLERTLARMEIPQETSA